ncbi:cytochrome P450 [Trametes versicolor FP-101664 SS1]|uniref:cytochrome P450 n=1 Tax=Trametes versicolor (strain FP-101664) TaxID=717944 RepID=UPI0004622FE8|nr:cytochrome P450 [Trametes versicolor FP-101664 SS1]EIW59559.1 cytochrome P450 [Trametes versicolor FP-101664 SS1]
MPETKKWLGFQDLFAKYGNIVHLNILGNHIVTIGDASVAQELLEKRSANTCDRPSSVVIPLIGNDVSFSVMPYGQWWRDHRRAFWQVFHPGAIRGYRDTERAFLHDFLRNLVASPQDIERHIRYLFAATMLKVLYGLDVQEEEGELIDRIHETINCTTSVMINKHAVDVFPFLRHLPAWVPGAGFQRVFAECKAAVAYAKEMPFTRMKAFLGAGQLGSTSSALAVLLSRIDDTVDSAKSAYQEDIAKDVGLVAFEAGADTSFSMLQGIFLAMSLYPEVLKKAQVELDAVVGPHRLPDFEDRDALIYVNAIIREALRWHVVTPLSVPHCTLEDDVFNGYFIPAGTTILANVWAMLHDPAVYEDPKEFRPERFIRDGVLDPTVRDPYLVAFGYGRRICPGRHFADDALYITIASVLHVFDIGPPLDGSGQPIHVKYEQTDGVITSPKDCRCVVRPRSEQARALVFGA